MENCKKCLIELKSEIVQMDLDENSYDETKLGTCPKCGEVYPLGSKLISDNAKIGYNSKGEYFNKNF